ncbi:RNA polymerase sigma factor SigZ [Ferrimonas balearica]|uniref:RNA polymerase sigma factor SigZ n=1 Tax=Ferrimonas balearica TaxID=44012 RepID=UPI001C99ACFC|nr:RNA polymerase sigma factor SigZ [Ferrimonas balearica]MBY5994156.1 RNA polymerase sigma factor SigZ [Ferrimonas balearica]
MQTHWQQHRAQLRQYISKRVDDSATVDDLLQEVYLKAHTQLHQLRAQGSLTAWLYRIAHNTIMDHHRQQRRWQALPEADELAAPEPDQAGLAHQELAQCLVPLIDELPERYRVPLKLAELEGMGQQAIADRLDLSLSGAKSRVQRARQQLRQKLTACCDIEVGRGGVLDFQPKGDRCGKC